MCAPPRVNESIFTLPYPFYKTTPCAWVVWCVFTEMLLTKVDEYGIIGIINKKYRKGVDKKHYLWYSGAGPRNPPIEG